MRRATPPLLPIKWQAVDTVRTLACKLTCLLSLAFSGVGAGLEGAGVAAGGAAGVTGLLLPAPAAPPRDPPPPTASAGTLLPHPITSRISASTDPPGESDWSSVALMRESGVAVARLCETCGNSAGALLARTGRLRSSRRGFAHMLAVFGYMTARSTRIGRALSNDPKPHAAVIRRSSAGDVDDFDNIIYIRFRRV